MKQHDSRQMKKFSIMFFCILLFLGNCTQSGFASSDDLEKAKTETRAALLLTSLIGRTTAATTSTATATTTTDYVRVRSSVVQTIVSNTETALNFEIEDSDESNLHSTTSETSRLTLASSGIYEFCGHGYLVLNSNFRSFSIYVNGSTRIASDGAVGNNSTDLLHSVCTIYKITAGDYVELKALSSGTTRNTVITADMPSFSAAKL